MDKPIIKAGAQICALVPTDIDQAFRLSQAIAQSGLAPNGMNKPEQIMIAVMHGMELGLPPMQAIQKIAVINGRPAIWGDAIPALLWSRGFKINETIEDNAATCTVTRPDGEQIKRTFTKADAEKAKLWGKPGPWQQYPKRMLQMRARSLAARDGAADVLSGLYVVEEAQDIVEASPSPEMKDITPALEVSARDGAPDAKFAKGNRPSSSAAKETGGMEKFQSLEMEIEAATTVDELQALYDKHERDGHPWAAFPTGWAKLIQTAYHYKLKEAMASAPEDVSQDDEYDSEDDSELVDADALLERIADDVATAEGDASIIEEYRGLYEDLVARMPKRLRQQAMSLLNMEDVQGRMF